MARRRLTLFLLALSLATAAWPSVASAAPTSAQRLGNQHADSSTVLNSGNVSTLRRAWFVNTTAGVSSTPLVWHGSVIFSDWNGWVWRVDARSGRVLWRSRLETPPVTGAWQGLAGTGVVAGSTLVEASVEGSAWGLDPATGTVNWQVRLTDDPYAGNLTDLLFDGTRVYVGMSSVDEVLAQLIPGFVSSSHGSVMALDPATGAKLWETFITQPPATGGAVWSSFAVDPALDLVFCDTGNNYTGSATDMTDALLALRASTGAVVWKAQVTANDVWVPGGVPPLGPDDDFGAGPQLFSARRAAATLHLVGGLQKSGVYWVFDRATGAPVWHTRLASGPKDNIGEASIGGGRIIYTVNARPAPGKPLRATIVARAAATGKRLWIRPAAQAPIGAGGFLAHDVYFAGDNAGRLRAYRARDGKVMWHGSSAGRLLVCASLWAQGRSLFLGLGDPTQIGPWGLEAFRLP